MRKKKKQWLLVTKLLRGLLSDSTSNMMLKTLLDWEYLAA